MRIVRGTSESPNKSNEIVVLDYIIIYLAFAFSSTSFFSADKYKLVAFFLLVSILFFRRKFFERFDNNMKLFLVYFVILYAIQSLMFEKTNNMAFVLVIAQSVILPFFLLSLTKKNFVNVYINIIVFFSVTSLLFWVFSNLYPQFYDFTGTIPQKYNTDLLPDNYKMFIIYTYEKVRVYNIIRNPGPTWEPGGWAVFLTLALLLNLMKNRKLITFKNLLIIANILSTFSTTGYLGLALIFLHYLIYSKGLHPIIKMLFVPAFIYLFFVFYGNSEFMNQKVQRSIQDAKERDITDVQSGRFFTLRKAALTFASYPISGRGLVTVTSAEEGQAEGTGYGIVDIGSRFGVPALILYLIILYRSLKLLNQNSGIQNKTFTLTAYLVLVLHLLSQTVYTCPIIAMIFYLPY